MTDIEHSHAKKAKDRVDALTAKIVTEANALSAGMKSAVANLEAAISEFREAATGDAIATNAALDQRMEELRKRMVDTADFLMGEVPKEIRGSTGRVLTPAEVAAKREAEDREAAFQAEGIPKSLTTQDQPQN